MRRRRSGCKDRALGDQHQTEGRQWWRRGRWRSRRRQWWLQTSPFWRSTLSGRAPPQKSPPPVPLIHLRNSCSYCLILENPSFYRIFLGVHGRLIQKDMEFLDHCPSPLVAATIICATDETPAVAFINPGIVVTWCVGLTEARADTCGRAGACAGASGLNLNLCLKFIFLRWHERTHVGERVRARVRAGALERVRPRVRGGKLARMRARVLWVAYKTLK
ncbi:uncharacterized protein LOC109728434 isoform X2 [Ananas comosus]|uniref:Uncharacterized protein LOC109728434 isoform X2 n=1 Tax=Ananas comosus TaxID=4615 RepID=A0A6P5H340_ANACO|nr:uncharacterized protein LOC109728434 isoform X2 [Ananas comosus]